MKKHLLLFLFITLISLPVCAGEVNIVNSVQSKDYSYSIEYLNSSDTRSVVSTGFVIEEQIRLDSSIFQKTTNPFYIKRSSGNKEESQQIIVEIVPEQFRNQLDELQSFYPSVALYNNGSNYSDSYYYGIAYTGVADNGLIFGINIPPVVHSLPADIGAFYLYYDSSLFSTLSIAAGSYSSNIVINITSDM